jgi:PAS domain S-box-containing protein
MHQLALLRRQSELHEALLRAQSDLDEGVALSDSRTERFLHVNDAFCRITGYTREELLALPSYVPLIAPARVEAVRTEVRNGRIANSDRLLFRKGGDELPVEMSAKPTGDGRLVAIVRDISARKAGE